MSKSLEALERLCKVKIYQKEASAYDYLGKEIYKEEFNIIKQDLERLEEINRVWHDNEPMEAVDINGKHLQDLYDYNMRLFEENLTLDKKVLELEKENQEWKKKLELTETARQLIYNELKCCSGMSEYIQKLKKAIEILKERGGIELFISRNNDNKLTLDFDDCISCVLEPKEYELLKEVLGDEGDN